MKMVQARKLFAAEWRKVWSNRRVAGCALIVWPMVALGGTIGYLIMALLIEQLRTERLLSWNDMALGVWDVPSQLFGRLTVVGVAAVIFGGEYQWRTWKNIVPRRPRLQIMAAKYVTLGAVIVLTFAVMSVVLTAGFGAVTLAVGGSYGPAPTGGVLGDFVKRYGIRAGLTFVETLIVGAITALLAMRGRSVLAGALGGLVVLFIDSLLPVGLSALAVLFTSSAWVEPLRLRFTYNLANVAAILQGGAPQPPLPFVSGETPGLVAGPGLNMLAVEPNSLGLSLAIIAAWLVGLVGLTLWLFQRQDLTE